MGECSSRMVNSAGNYVKDMSAVQWGTVPLQNGGDTGTIFYTDFASGTGAYTATSQSLGTINCGPLALAAGYTSAVRCKIGAAIFSVTPLASTSPAGADRRYHRHPQRRESWFAMQWLPGSGVLRPAPARRRP